VQCKTARFPLLSEEDLADPSVKHLYAKLTLELSNGAGSTEYTYMFNFETQEFFRFVGSYNHYGTHDLSGGLAGIPIKGDLTKHHNYSQVIDKLRELL